jgi:crotonobetainyl-CoA:carnitine CoA-transferase CaiB-like acyl-CoA transferase
MCGAAYLSGTLGQPMKAAVSWVDITTATLSAFGTLAALQERARTGRGQEVRSSLLGAALTSFNWLLMEEALTGVGREATGNRSHSGAPADFFRTRDGWITVQVIGDPLFRRWVALIGEPEWLSDERFASDAARVKNSSVLCERTARWCATLTTAEAIAALERARIPGGPILSPRQVLQDTHVREANMLTPMDYPGLEGPAPLVFAGLQLSESQSGLRRRAPQLGEHTTEVLTSLGYSGTEIEALRASRTI